MWLFLLFYFASLYLRLIAFCMGYVYVYETRSLVNFPGIISLWIVWGQQDGNIGWLLPLPALRQEIRDFKLRRNKQTADGEIKSNRLEPYLTLLTNCVTKNKINTTLKFHRIWRRSAARGQVCCRIAFLIHDRKFIAPTVVNREDSLVQKLF